MTARRLLILGGLALLAIVAGLWLSSQRPSGSGELNATLYPALKGELDSLTAVRIFKAGDARAVELLRSDSTWKVTESAGYPADSSKVRTLLLDIAQAKVVEEKTSNPENYATLGVEDVSNADASGVRIELIGVATPANLIVGKQGMGAKSTYVRRAGEAQSWLIDASLDTTADAGGWLQKSILDVSADRLQSATVTLGRAKPYTASKASRADANFSVDNLPKGKELSSPSAANSVASALLGLTLTDVRVATEFDTEVPTASAVLRTFDGLVVTLDGWANNDKRFIRAATSFDAGLAERFRLPTSTPATEQPKDAAATPASATSEEADKAPQTNVAEQAQSLDRQLSGWIYEIPQYNYDAIFKPLEEILKE